MQNFWEEEGVCQGLFKMKERIILYRRGEPRGAASCWFTRVDEAVYSKFPGDVYFLLLGLKEFELCFRENGIGYVLREDYRGVWQSLHSRIQKVPQGLIERMDPSLL